MNFCCLLVAFCRCLGFSVSSLGLNLGMDDITQIHPKAVLRLTLACPVQNSISKKAKY